MDPVAVIALLNLPAGTAELARWLHVNERHYGAIDAAVVPASGRRTRSPSVWCAGPLNSDCRL